jgi:transmembrane sensor
MDNSPTYHSELITKYLAGEITEEEIRVLKIWLQSDPRHQKLYEEYKNTWFAIEKSKIDTTVVVEEEWIKLKSKIKGGHGDRKPEVRIIRNRSGFTSLPFYNDNRIKSGFHWALTIAAVFILVVIPSFLLFRYFGNSRNVSITARDQMTELNLPDGTSVSLNRGSTLEYPEHFTGTTREIKLTGEACFSVKHDDKSRFVIANGRVRIEDIGTSFYVNTNRPGGFMEVVLIEGKASVYFTDNPSGQVFILPGEKADIRMNGNTIRKTINNDVNYLAWKTRRLVFKNNNMIEVVTLLNEVYHSDIRLSDDNLNNCRLTAIFDNQSLESILNVIKSTLDVSIISNGPTFEISGKKCDL